MARKEKELHMQLYPGWSARDNYATRTKKKKLKRDPRSDNHSGTSCDEEQSKQIIIITYTRAVVVAYIFFRCCLTHVWGFPQMNSFLNNKTLKCIKICPKSMGTSPKSKPCPKVFSRYVPGLIQDLNSLKTEHGQVVSK